MMSKDIEITVPLEGSSRSEHADQNEVAEGECWSEGNDPWLASIMIEEDQRINKRRTEQPKIQVVSRLHVKENYNKCMDPQVVSLGPCHHGKPWLNQMEMQKKIAARRFVLNCSLEIGRCYDEIKKVIEKARESYATEILDGISDRAFTRMMFLDGCFMAYFIEGSNQGRIESKVTCRLFPLIVCDMFLLENQLPFVVLQGLMQLRFRSNNEAIDQIFKFITRHATLTNFFHYPDGILWFVRLLLSPCGFLDYVFFMGRCRRAEPLHLLDLLRCMLLRSRTRWPTEETDEEAQRHIPHQLRSVVELKDNGIGFGRSNSGRLTSVRFVNSFFLPRILLPEMLINDAAISQMLNLIALESCFGSYSSDTGVSSFLKLMKSLIGSGEDVKELRTKGILHHGLGSDEEVAKLFHDLPIDDAADLEAYRDVKRRVVQHCYSGLRISLGRWSHTYFGSRWAAITSFAAVILLFMTALQTVFTIFPRG